jgi:ABC-2 type transport system ATP-binding protein
VIQASDLHKSFGGFQAVRGISLDVPPGEVIALLGPNGAGKSTTVRMLTAMLQPSHGTARVAGYDVVREPQHVRAQVGLLTEYPGLYARMNALDYLVFFGRLQGLVRHEALARAERYLRRFGLWDARARKLGTYSKGMQQKVALVRAMLHDPQVLFLDEPTTAMDPQSAHIVRGAIAELRDERRVIVLCTHDLHEAELLADRIAVLQRGQIVALGTVQQLTRQLLGDPIWEIQTAAPLGAAVDRLRTLVSLEQLAPDRIRYRTADARCLNPALIASLLDAAAPVISIQELPRSLKSVYLTLVGEPPLETDQMTRPGAYESWAVTA